MLNVKTLLYVHDNHYCFSFILQKLLQYCLYLWSWSVTNKKTLELKWLFSFFLRCPRNLGQGDMHTTIAHFADMAAILNSIVLNIYYGMLMGQLNMYLPPEHPIIEI